MPMMSPIRAPSSPRGIGPLTPIEDEPVVVTSAVAPLAMTCVLFLPAFESATNALYSSGVIARGEAARSDETIELTDRDDRFVYWLNAEMYWLRSVSLFAEIMSRSVFARLGSLRLA